MLNCTYIYRVKLECSEADSSDREFLVKISVVSAFLDYKAQTSKHLSGMPLLFPNVFIPVLSARRETLDTTSLYRNNVSELHAHVTEYPREKKKKDCKKYACVNHVYQLVNGVLLYSILYTAFVGRVISIIPCTLSFGSSVSNMCFRRVSLLYQEVRLGRLVPLPCLTVATPRQGAVPLRFHDFLFEKHEYISSYNMMRRTVTCIGKDELPSPAGHTPICLQTL